MPKLNVRLRLFIRLNLRLATQISSSTIALRIAMRLLVCWSVPCETGGLSVFPALSIAPTITLSSRGRATFTARINEKPGTVAGLVVVYR